MRRTRSPRPVPLHGVPGHGQGEHRPRGDADDSGVPRWPTRWHRSTRRSSSGCAPRGRSRSAAPTSPTSACASTDSSLRGLTRNPGTRPSPRAAPAAARCRAGERDVAAGARQRRRRVAGNPAHCCGIASIKPSPGRVPHATVIPPEDFGPAMQSMAVQGVMARRESDVRLAGARRRSAPARPRLGARAARPAADRVPARRAGGGTAGRRHPPGDRGSGAARGRRARRRGLRGRRGRAPLYETSLDVWGRFLFTDIAPRSRSCGP